MPEYFVRWDAPSEDMGWDFIICRADSAVHARKLAIKSGCIDYEPTVEELLWPKKSGIARNTDDGLPTWREPLDQ